MAQHKINVPTYTKPCVHLHVDAGNRSLVALFTVFHPIHCPRGIGPKPVTMPGGDYKAEAVFYVDSRKRLHWGADARRDFERNPNIRLFRDIKIVLLARHDSSSETTACITALNHAVEKYDLDLRRVLDMIIEALIERAMGEDGVLGWAKDQSIPESEVRKWEIRLFLTIPALLSEERRFWMRESPTTIDRPIVDVVLQEEGGAAAADVLSQTNPRVTDTARVGNHRCYNKHY